MTEKRLALALLAGGLISLTLFWLMQAMISQTEKPKLQTVVNVIDFIKLKKLEKEPETKRKPLPKESLPPPPPPPPLSMAMSTPVAAKSVPEMEIPEVEISQPDLLSNSDVKLKVFKPKPKPKPKVRPKIVIKKTKVIKTKVKPRSKPKIRAKSKPKIRVKSKPKIRAKSKPVKKIAKVQTKAIKPAPKPKVKPKPVKVKPKKVAKVKPKKVKPKKVAKAAPKMASGISSNVRATYKTAPKYPKRASRRRQEGWVKVQFIITAAGTVKSPFVVASKPSGVFNKEALRAIRRWKFKPKLINGQRVAQRAVQTIKFKLR